MQNLITFINENKSQFDDANMIEAQQMQQLEQELGFELDQSAKTFLQYANLSLYSVE